MTFTPAPENDFVAFHQTCFARLRERCPGVRALAAKWTFEDLIPGLSDLDARLIFADGTGVAQWNAASVAAGEVYAQMVREFPHWARNLEHLPGLNLTVAEVKNPWLYTPEFLQWTFYEGDAATIGEIQAHLSGIAWSARDERYHLKKVAGYLGPYRRGIDPPINLGPWENKYPLHSRYLHYFAPAVQALASLAQKTTISGKIEGLRQARALFPHPEIVDRVLESIERHFEIPEDYAEPRLTQIERELEGYLADAWESVAPRVTQIDAIPLHPVAAFFDGIKFARFMRGRLLFYATDLPGFDAIWLIQNELGRIGPLFFDKPLTTYGAFRFAQELWPEQVLERLRGGVLREAECEGMAEFARVVKMPLVSGQEKAQARAVAAVFEPVVGALETLGEDVLQCVRNTTKKPDATLL